MQFFGIDGEGLRQAVSIAVSTAIGGIAVYAWFKRKLDRYFKKEYDSYLVSVTSPEDLGNGKYEFCLDTLGGAEKFADALRGADVREVMLAAANRCTWDPKHRFLLLSDDDAEEVERVVINSLSKYFADGLKAKLAGRPYETKRYHFAVTGSDADAAGTAKRKFRVLFENDKWIDMFRSTTEESWQFDKQSHKIRLETCKVWADAIRTNNGCLKMGKPGKEKEYRISFKIRVYVPL